MFRTSKMMGSLNGFVGTHVSAGSPGTGNGTLMGSTGLNQMLNGSIGAHTPTAVPGQGVGTMMGVSAGVSASNIGWMMNGIIQDTLNGSADTPATAQSIVQAVLDIMDDMPGIHLIGLAHMNLFDATAAESL